MTANGPHDPEEQGAGHGDLRPGSHGILLHIGVHKTGTTALQAAFAASRPQLADLGIAYPGAGSSHHRQVRAVMRKPWGWGATSEEVSPEPWTDLLAEIGDRDRVVVSSEFLGEADEEQAAAVVADLRGGTDRPITVLITLRPLLDLTPSSYQQFLKYGMKHTYERWLQRILPYTGVAHGPFWMRNDHGAVVQRWARLVGAGNMVVVILDPDDRQFLFREVSGLLGIDPAILLENQQPVANRSMTAAESALVREMNLRYRGPRDWRWYDKYIRKGMVKHLVESRRPGPDEPMLVTPPWAVAELLSVARRSDERIRAAGVRVRGDLSRLTQTPPVDASSSAAPDHLPLDAAVAAMTGLADRISATKKPAGPPKPRPVHTRLRARLARLRKSRRRR